MNYSEINKAFSQAVSAKLAEGYIIETCTMSGHQGEVAKVTFTKDAKFYALVLDKKHNFGGKSNFVLTFIISNELDGEVTEYDSWKTFWLGEKHCSVLETKIWTEVREGFYVEDNGEEIAKKHYVRSRKFRDYEFETVTEVPMNAKNRKVISKIYKANRAKGRKVIPAADINSATIKRYNREMVLVVTTEEGKFQANIR